MVIWPWNLNLGRVWPGGAVRLAVEITKSLGWSFLPSIGSIPESGTLQKN